MKTVDLLVKNLAHWPACAESIHQRKDGAFYFIVNGIAVVMDEKQLKSLPVADDAGKKVSRAEFEQYNNKNNPQLFRASFQQAAMPLIQWLSENSNTSQYALVTEKYAELLTSQIVVSTDQDKKL